jgi:hypothetical protein
MAKRVTRGKVPTRRVELEGGDWVTGKGVMTLRDREKVNARLAQFDDETGKASIDTTKANTYTLFEMIVDWGGPGFCVVDHDVETAPEHDTENGVCRIEDIDEDAIAGLDDETARELVKAFTKRPKAKTESEASKN